MMAIKRPPGGRRSAWEKRESGRIICAHTKPCRLKKSVPYLAAGASPRPTGPHRPGGGDFNERVRGYKLFSGSGARGSTGRLEGAAGQ